MTDMSPRPLLRVLANLLVPTYLLLVAGTPALLILDAARHLSQRSYLSGCLEFLLAPIAYVLVAGVLALPHRRHVVQGRMPVDTRIPPYFHRRLYGLCWTAVYYSGPIYYAVLTVPLLRRAVFRLFGYRGSMDFTIYPDTWIRDLPLLDFGKGSYLSNKATIGTNMIFIRNNQKIIEVGSIVVGEHAMVGHLTMIGPSTRIGDQVQIGVGCGIGRRVEIEEGAVVGDKVICDHGVKIGPSAIVGTSSYLGMGVRIPEGFEVPVGSVEVRRSRTGRAPVAVESKAG